MADKKTRSKTQAEQDKAQAEQGQEAGAPVPAGVQQSPAASPPMTSQDAYGRPVNIELDPETGAPVKKSTDASD